MVLEIGVSSGDTLGFFAAVASFACLIWLLWWLSVILPAPPQPQRMAAVTADDKDPGGAVELEAETMATGVFFTRVGPGRLAAAGRAGFKS